ncbi:MAG: hypothetical protein QM504_03115 [Pseudomonadota bacterium]
MKKSTLTASIAMVITTVSSHSAYAVLAESAVLNFDAGVTTSSLYGAIFVKSGSYFGMDMNGVSGIKPNERIAISQNNGILLGTAQSARGSHRGC